MLHIAWHHQHMLEMRWVLILLLKLGGELMGSMFHHISRSIAYRFAISTEKPLPCGRPHLRSSRAVNISVTNLFLRFDILVHCHSEKPCIPAPASHRRAACNSK
jgi:hypothetical protein